MAKDENVSGYSKPIEHERGQDAAPLGNINAPRKAATYRTPGVHPAPHPNQNQDTGPHRGDKARTQRAIKVQP